MWVELAGTAGGQPSGLQKLFSRNLVLVGISLPSLLSSACHAHWEIKQTLPRHSKSPPCSLSSKDTELVAADLDFIFSLIMEVGHVCNSITTVILFLINILIFSLFVKLPRRS